MVKPRNYLLLACHVTNESMQLTQGYRYWRYQQYARRARPTRPPATPHPHGPRLPWTGPCRQHRPHPRERQTRAWSSACRSALYTAPSSLCMHLFRPRLTQCLTRESRQSRCGPPAAQQHASVRSRSRRPGWHQRGHGNVHRAAAAYCAPTCFPRARTPLCQRTRRPTSASVSRPRAPHGVRRTAVGVRVPHFAQLSARAVHQPLHRPAVLLAPVRLCTLPQY
jgi:hypothetical protein